MQRGDQVVERARAGLDQLHRAVGVDVAGQALGEHLDLLCDELLERPLVAERVVDSEADPLVVAARAEAADRLDDPHVRRRVAAAVRAQHPEVGETIEDLLGNLVAASDLLCGDPLALARQGTLEDPVLELDHRPQPFRLGFLRSSRSRITRSGMNRSSWSCLISRIRSTNSGG